MGNHVAYLLELTLYVTAAGWQAGNTWLDFIQPELNPVGAHAGLLRLPSYYSDEYYFYLWAGTHKPHRKGGRSCSLGTRNY